MIYKMKSGNYVETVRTYECFIELWPGLLHAGLAAMNERSAMGENEDTYLKQMLCMMASWPDGAIGVLYSKNAKPLGFTAVFNATPAFGGEKVLYVYALYSNGKDANTSKELLDWGRRCAKQFGYKKMSMETGNLNGGAVQFFTRKLGFTAKKVMFTQEIS